MEGRPVLSRQLDETTFREYYYLKEELVQFCRENGLPVSGGKIEITDRIAAYLRTGAVTEPKRSVRPGFRAGMITKETVIEENIVCSERHREFFKEQIGESFTFNVAFQKWLKENAGKTYAQAIEAYGRILEEKKQGKTAIGKQFEYNTYIRDFFADNPGKALEQAIACWNWKKALRGHNRYERSDLSALDKANGA
ncbi:DUF6434 domain-containing protein [Anaerolentibacter hominis]|uniref:DUF6434 domain-containing protein n=1 Tax=Anaerolentibacter hominis TaxID=3079009 RepID=UPI0031B83F04